MSPIVSLLCPLCAQTTFSSIDALRNCLIKIANGPLTCPICEEQFLGLDKLTIHLFSHNNTCSTTTATLAPVRPVINDFHRKNHNHSEYEIDKEEEINPIRSRTNNGIRKIIDVNENENKKTQCENETMMMMSDLRMVVNFENTHNLRNDNEYENHSEINAQLDEQQQASQLHGEQQICEQNLASNSDIYKCVACDLNFPNTNLRDIHQMLMHDQNSSASLSNVETGRGACVFDGLDGLGGADASSSSTPFINNSHDYKCHICLKTFHMKGSLRIHLKVVHMIVLPDDSDIHNIKKVFTTFNEADISRPHECDDKAEHKNPENGFCGLISRNNIQNITSSDEFRKEVKTLETGNNNNNITNALNPATLDNFNPKIWECDICSKCFTTKYFLKKHKRLHTGEMPYTCEICSRTFTFQQSYHKHLLYHSDEKPHICQTCGRAFKELSTLHNHERIHSGEKPFKCDICGKCFRQRVSFLVHTRIHTGVMPYKCELCDKNFRYKVSQRTHKCQMVTNNYNKNDEESNRNRNEDDCVDNIDKPSAKNKNENSSTDIGDATSYLDHPLRQQDHQQGESKIANNISISNIESSVPLSPLSTSLLTTNQLKSKLNLNRSNDFENEFELLEFNDPLSPLEQLQNMRLYSPQLLLHDNDLTRFLLDNSSSDFQ